VNEAMFTLSHRERDAVVLRLFEGMSFGEVGEALNITTNTARVLVGCAIEKLRRHLERRGVTVSTLILLAVLESSTLREASASTAALVATTATAVVAGRIAGVGPHFLSCGFRNRSPGRTRKARYT
jgi:hypothetical protein